MIGTTIAHYRVKEKIGEGGMGEVYLAEDTSLKRKVALKVLTVSLQQDPKSHKRFIREAESAAALDHPFVCKIYEVGEYEGRNFIAMEFIQGQTLKEKLDEGRLQLEEAVKIGSEIAEALEEAHERGIIHRDLKPSNIMLTPKGHVQVLDFGLAKRVVEEGQEVTTEVTQEGATLGTLAYMSPEQLRGAPVDTRSDIFSFGIVLYEMLTGVHPFRKGQSMETASAILATDPDTLTRHNKDVPELLENTVFKMLAKDPSERYQSVHEVAAHLSDPTALWTQTTRSTGRLWVVMALTTLVAVTLLGWWIFRESTTQVNPVVSSIAVLPLANLSGDPEQDYFVDGMTEALITDLSKIGALKIISRSSAMRYKGTDKSLAEIARELDVESIIEGSVLREGDRVRITAQLIEASTDRNLWAERYERNLTSIMALQGEVAQAIARQIQVTLTPQEEILLTRTRQVNPEAYEAYLKGQSHFYKINPADLEIALQYFESAREIDPEYALAHVGIALAWVGLRQLGAVPPNEAGPKVRAAIQKAFELDDNLAEAYYALALDKTWGEYDWEAAETAFLRAIELNPNFPDAHVYYSNLLCYLGRPEEALAQGERAILLDPYNSLFQSIYGSTLYFMRRYDDAIQRYRNTLKINPGDPIGHSGLWEIFHLLGRYGEAAESAKAGFSGLSLTPLAEIMEQGYKEGDYLGAMHLVAEAMAELSRETLVLPSINAQLYLFAGEKEKALDWLEKGFEIRDPMMPYIIWPNYEIVRDEPRYQDILKRMNFPDHVIDQYPKK